MAEINAENPFECGDEIESIFTELVKAVKKHPKFCDFAVDGRTDWAMLERMMKSKTEAPFFGENILLEEVAESMNAVKQGKLKEAYWELAQVGAVAIRLMKAVKAEAAAKVLL